VCQPGCEQILCTPAMGPCRRRPIVHERLKDVCIGHFLEIQDRSGGQRYGCRKRYGQGGSMRGMPSKYQQPALRGELR